MQLLLVRHGCCGSEHSQRFIGASDPDLSEIGRQQVAALTAQWNAQKSQRCFCSPLKRCRQTAAPLADALRLKIEIEADLREIDFGRWEGLTFEEIAVADPEIVKQWADFTPGFRFPGGESLKDFLARVDRVITRLTAADDAVLVVTHGGVIRTTICHLLGLSPRQYVLFDVKPTSLVTINVCHGKGVLAGLNEPLITANERE
ncbi:MAG: alpha-ribazole phosphatase [Planctomycetota bacterium]